MDPRFKSHVYKDMMRLAKEKGLTGLEKPKQIWIEKEPFTTENGLLTHTSKLKRNVAKKHFEDKIKDLYAQVE